MRGVEGVLVVAGAGTNPPLSTRLITDYLLNWRRIVEPGRKPDDPDARPFFAWLAEQLRDVFPKTDNPYDPPTWTSAGQANFEELLHVVERLTYLMHVHYYDMMKPKLPPYEQPFYEISAIGHQLKGFGIYDVLVFASNAILDFVTEQAAALPGNDSRALMRAIDEHYTPHLYSLNYDSNLAVDTTEWWTGFGEMTDTMKKHTKPGDPRLMFRTEASTPQDEPVFAQLHGSTNFGWIENEWRAPHYVIARYPTPRVPHRTPRRIGFEQWGDRTALPVMPMITGFRKAEKILAEPFASYYHCLRTDAFRCNRWLVLGYAVGDPHVNAALESVVDYWGDRLRVWVCNRADPGPWTADDQAYRYDLRRTTAMLGRRRGGAQGATLS